MTFIRRHRERKNLDGHYPTDGDNPLQRERSLFELAVPDSNGTKLRARIDAASIVAANKFTVRSSINC